MADILSNRCRPNNALGCQYTVASIGCLYRRWVRFSRGLHRYICTPHWYWTLPCADISWWNTVINFAAEYLDYLIFRSQTSCIISKLRRKFYAPTFEIWNISSLMRFNMHISLERNTFLVSTWSNTFSHSFIHSIVSTRFLFIVCSCLRSHTIYPTKLRCAVITKWEYVCRHSVAVWRTVTLLLRVTDIKTTESKYTPKEPSAVLLANLNVCVCI
jgi:hypothetical protein